MVIENLNKHLFNLNRALQSRSLLEIKQALLALNRHQLFNLNSFELTELDRLASLMAGKMAQNPNMAWGEITKSIEGVAITSDFRHLQAITQFRSTVIEAFEMGFKQ